MQFQAVTILLEADEDQARLFEAILTEDKVRVGVRIATSDGEVLASLRGFPLPDMVVLNHSLPGGDALGVLREIRSDPDLRSIPVVMLVDSVEPDADVADRAEPGAPARDRLPRLAVDLFAIVRSIDQLGLCITTTRTAEQR
jgi:CheY-like chemotaxis protein